MDIRAFFSPQAAAKASKQPEEQEKQEKQAESDPPANAKRQREADERVEGENAERKKPKSQGEDEIGQDNGEDGGEDLQQEQTPVAFKYGNLLLTLQRAMHESWYEQLRGEFQRAYFTNLASFLKREEASKRTIYPPPQDVFAALRDCAFSDIKVVILGQDPYHGPEQAHGLSFSVRRGVQPPPSLKNIYKEAMADVAIARPTHGCLSSWSQQGVLLLNTVLTVRRGEPFTHKKQGWEQFTDAIIRTVSRRASNVVFLLWGKPAQAKGEMIDRSKHLIIQSSHPSPLGATKTNAPFIGSKCFSKANAYLKKHGKAPIDWSVPS